MAKNSVRDFDATAANNTDIQSVDIAENCAPSGINNAIRELMADIKDVSTGTIALESPSADSLTVTGDLTVDTNTLYVDSTNNRVGVGTSSPDQKLTVASEGRLRLYRGDNTRYGDIYNDNNFLSIETSHDPIKLDGQGYIRFDTNSSERMRIDSSGNVGIGTTSPSTSLDVVRAGVQPLRVESTSGTEVAINMVNTGGNAQIEAHNGKINFDVDGLSINTNSMHDFGVNNHEFQINGVKGGSLAFSRGTNGATEQWALRTSDDDALRFERGANYASESMRIDSSGNLLVGTTTVNGSGGVSLRSDGAIIAPAVYGIAVSASIRDLYIDSSGFIGYSTSTRATKGNIENLSDVSWLYNLNPVSFNRKVNGEELSPELEYGLIAEDVEEVNAELCFYNETDNGQELAGITYSKLITPLLKALQEANERIETLEAKVTTLENA